MKLHLPKMLAAALLAAVTAIGNTAAGEDVDTTFTTTNSTTNLVNNFEGNGFTCILTGSRMKTTSDPADVPISGSATVNLTSVTLVNLRHVPGGDDSVGLALTDSSGTVLSLATNTVASTGSATWNFADGTTVATDSSLYFVFYKASNTYIQVGYTLQQNNTDMYQGGAGANGVANYGNTTDYVSCAFLGSNVSYNLTPNNSNYGPGLSIVTTGTGSAVAPYVWAGSGTTAAWDTASSNWTVDGSSAVYASGEDTIVHFTVNGAKTVTVDEAIVAGTVDVQDNYTFAVSDDGSLSIGSLTVGDGYTAGLSGYVDLGSLSGAISIAEEGIVNLNSAVTLSDTAPFQVSGAGLLMLGDMTASGGSHTLEANLFMNSLETSGNANVTINGKEVTVLGKIHTASAGDTALSVGMGDTATTLVAGRLEVGDYSGDSTANFTIGEKGKVVVTSENNEEGYKAAGLLFSEWGQHTNVEISGTLLSRDAMLSTGNQSTPIAIYGTVATKGIRGIKTVDNTIHLNDGAKLILGDSGITADHEGAWTINLNGGEVGISADSTIARNLNVAGNVTFNTAKYVWDGEGAAQTIAAGDEGGTMSVSASITGEGTVIVAGTGELVLTGAANVLTHAIQLTSGTLTMDGGTFDISALEGGTIEEKGYEDGENKGNGFLVMEGGVQVVEITNGASLNGASADLLYKGSTVHLNNATGAVEMGGKVLSTFYVNESGTKEKLSWALGKAGTELKGVVLDNGTTFTLDVEAALDTLTLKENASATVAVSKDATIGTITAPTAGQALDLTGEGTVTTDSLVGGGTVGIGEKIVLVNNATTAPTAKAVLGGSGTYVLAPQVLNMNSATLGEDWTGTVRISHPTHNAAIDFTPFVKGSNSTLELNGVMGWSSTWNSDTPQNIKLTDNGGDLAWVCSGYSMNDYTAIYSGKWTGDGTYVSYSKNGGTRFTNATFTGDIADWEGAFLYKSDAAASTGSIVFRDNATDVNITIGKDGDNGTLNVKAETGATFSKNVSAGQLVVDAADKTVTLGGGADLDAATVTAGTLALASTGLVIDALTVDSGSTLSAAAGSSLQSAVTLAEGSSLSVEADGLNLVYGASTLTLGGKIAFNTSAIPGDMIVVASGLTEGDITGITFTGGVAAASDYLTLSPSLASYTQLQVKDGKLVLTKEAGSGSYWGKGIGSGTWNLSAPNWAKVDGDTASVVFTNGADAYFTANGGGGTITVGEAIDVATLNVSGAAYTFTGTKSLNITGGVFVSSSGSATFDQIGTLPVISISGAGSSMTVSSGNVTVQDLSSEGSLTVTAGNLAIGKATAKGGNVKANNLSLATGESAFGSVQVSGTVTGATKLTVGGTSAIGSVEDIGTLALDNGTLALGNATGLSNTQLGGALTVSGEAVNLGNVAMADGSSISSANKVMANGITVTGTGTVKGGATLQASAVGGGTLAVENGIVGIASGSTMTVSGTLDVKSGAHVANSGTLSVAGKVIAGNGVNLGNVAATGTVEVNGASVSATGGSIAALDMGSGETLTVANNLALTSTTGGNSGTLNVGGALTAGGAVTVANATAGTLELTTGTLTATGTLAAGSITLDRVSKTDHYLTAGSLSATTTAFVVDKALIEALNVSAGQIITLADLDSTHAGAANLTINGAKFITDRHDLGYYISQDSATKDIILIARNQESNYVWVGVNENWSDAANWSGGMVPDEESWAQFNGGEQSILLDTPEPVRTRRVTVSAGTHDTIYGDQELLLSQSLEVDANASLNVGDGSTPTAIETPTATINGTLVVQPRAAVQADATTINGGTLNVNDATYIAETIDMAGGALRTSLDSYVTTGQLNGDADSIVGGHVIITGTGGRYSGGYDAAYIDIDDDAEAVLYAGEGLTLGGDGTAKLQYSGNTAIDGIDADELTILLNDPHSSSIGSTLTLRESSWLEEGSVEFGMSAIQSAKTLGIGAPVILQGDLALGEDARVVVNQDRDTDKGKVMQVGNRGETRNLVLARFGSQDTNTRNVVLNGDLYDKYFKNARIEGGELLVDLNDTYYQTVSGATTHNGRAGAGMLDDALVELNPQAYEDTWNGDLATVMTALDNGAYSADRADRILAAMSGASHAAMGYAWSHDVDRQLRAIRNRTTSMGVGECVVNEDMPYVNAWINAEGDYTKFNNDGTLAGYKLSSWGGTLGVDVDCTNRFTMGVAVTAMSGDFTALADDNAEGDLDRMYVTVFGRYTRGSWTHTLVGTIGMADTNLKRTVDYGTGRYTTDSSSDGTAYGVMYEAGYAIALNESASTCLQPMLNLSYRHSSLDGFTETGSTDAALRGGDAATDVVSIALGARLQSIIGTSVYNRSSIFEGRMLFKFDAGDRDTSMHSSFVNVQGVRNVRSAEMGSFGLELGAGIVVPVAEDGGSFFFDVTAELRDKYTEVNGTAGYRYNF